MPKHDEVTASEFAAILNGDNPNEILVALKQFVRKVRSERRRALAWNDDEDAEDDDDHDEDMSDGDDKEDDVGEAETSTGNDGVEPPSKKYKKSEAWKADTASYNVPFVGTSVARGEHAPIILGEWPTGLLKMYLVKSPLALELLNEDLIAPNGKIHRGLLKKKKGKQSRAISKAHLLAIAELLTSAIPLTSLSEYKSKDGDDKHMLDSSGMATFDPKFLSPFLKARMPWIFEVLNDETDKGRGKSEIVGGCGSLAAPALKLLQNVSMISISAARLVAKYLDENLNDGVLKVCLRPFPLGKERNLDDSDDNEIVRSKPSRTEAIELATILLKVRDAVVNTYICGGGSRERKVKPGIMFVAVRDGLASNSRTTKKEDVDDDDYRGAVTNLLASVRQSLFVGGKNSSNSKFLLSLMTREPLAHLCRLSCYAPPLRTGKRTFADVLHGQDTVAEDESTLESVGLESRRLLFLFLAVRTFSPFLQHKEDEQIARCLTHLLESESATLELRRFILFCTVENPCLMQHLLRLITLPDPKRVFEFVSRANFISNLLRKGPSPMDSLHAENSGEKRFSAGEIASAILPLKLQGQVLTKSLLNGNALVKLETLRLIIVVKERFEFVRSEGMKLYNWDEELIAELCTSIFHWLPDLQSLLSLRSRFDVFSKDKSGGMVADCLFRVIEFYTSISPSLIEHSNVDWIKLLPENAPTFHEALPLVQVRLLTCIKNMIQSRPHYITNNMLVSSRIVFDIMLSTTNKMVHKLSRSICCKLIIQALLPPAIDEVTLVCVEHEARCWIDAVCSSSLAKFIKLLHDVRNHPLTYSALVGQSWSKHDVVKTMNCSLVLAAALSTSDLPRPFQTLVAQVTARCLMYVEHPLSLAALISCAREQRDVEKTESSLCSVSEYAGALLEWNRLDDVERKSILKNFVSRCFSKASSFSAVAGYLVGDRSFESACRPRYGLVSFIKAVNHSFLFLGNGDGYPDRYWKILDQCLPLLVLNLPPETTFSSLLATVYSMQGSYFNFDRLDVTVLSCHFAASGSFVRRKMEVKVDSQYISNEERFCARDKRAQLLQLCMFSASLSSAASTKIKLSLLADSRDDFSGLGLKFSLHFKQDRAEKSRAVRDPDILKRNVDALVFVSREVKEVGSVLERERRVELCKLLTGGIERGNLEAATILLLVGKESPESMVTCALSLSIENRAWIETELNFFSTIMKNDFFRLFHPTIEELRNMASSMSKAWAVGFLDGLLDILFQRARFSSSFLDSFQQTMVPHIIRRVVQSLKTASVTNEVSVLNSIISITRLTADVLDASNNSCFSLEDLATEVIRVVSFPVNNLKTPQPGKMTIMRMGFCLLRHFQRIEGSSVYGQLAYCLVLFVLTSLPILLKQDASEATSGLTAETSLQWLVSYFAESHAEEVFFRVEASLVHKVIRSCLKSGLNSPAVTSTINCLSLELVNILVRLSGNSGSPLSSLIRPRDVFDMITSHSKFETLFTEIDSVGEENIRLDYNQQEAVIELMISCIAVSDAEVTLRQSVWKTILCSFNAGLGRLDNLIRKLASVCPDGSLPFSDEIRWTGHSALNQLHSASSRWDWLAEAVDHSRLRSTISSFPSSEIHDPDTVFADSWTFPQGLIENHGKDNNEDEREPTSNFPEKKQSGGGEYTRKTRAYRKDYRYSLAVLLPAVLGALESEITNGNTTLTFSSMTESDLRNVPDVPADTTDSAASTETVQRLCEKGIVSLCLVALSSASEEIRAYSVCVLGIVLCTAGTIKAQESSTWRNRSQLVMILNSVQRSLVVLKACSRGDGSDSNSLFVPKLPPLVSLFLARASLVLSRPDDDLYVPLNRYFLKTEDDCGAFQDTNRLPGFMSLFCSANENPEQSRAERLWALQLLRDGLVDSASYRLVASCHAPELILSSFEIVRLSKQSVEAKSVEYCLLQDVLKVMVENGGYSAHTHLLGRMGILSWLRSYCTSRPLEEAFPTSKSACSFYKLVNSVIDVARRSPKLTSQVSSEEALGLIQPVVSLSLRTLSSSEQVTDSIFLDAVDVLDSIGRLLKTISDDGGSIPRNEIHPLGIAMETSIRIMHLAQRVDNDDDDCDFQKRTLRVLCNLPVSLSKKSLRSEDESVVVGCNFFILSLDCCLATDSAMDGPLTRLVLKRLILYADHPNGNFVAGATMMDPILQRLFLMRCKICVGFDESLYSLWVQCLKLLSRHYKGGNKFLKFGLEHI